MRKIIWLISVAVLILTGINISPTFGEEVKISEWVKSAINSLMTSEGMHRRITMETIQSDRRAFINNLMKIVQDDKVTVKDKIDVIQLLGDYRAEEAISVLVKNISTKKEIPFMTRFLTLEDFYPSILSLEKLGLPSLHPLLEGIEQIEMPKNGRLTESDELVMTLTARVFDKVLGKKLAKFYIDEYRKNKNADVNSAALNRLKKTISSQRYL